jgi:hypothetical protein
MRVFDRHGMAKPGNRGACWQAAPGFAEFIIGLADGRTRWLNPGYLQRRTGFT